jgi:hypothetical protein
MKYYWLIGALIVAVIASISGFHGFFGNSFLSICLLLVLLLTALPISHIVFKSSSYSIIFCFPIAYIAHSVLLSLVALVFGISTTVIAAYIVICSGLFLFWYFKGAHFEKDWTTLDTALLWTWLLVTLAAISLPLIHVGIETPQGYAFRAYFNADFFKHLGITAALSNSGIPPSNYYFEGTTLHYYWFFYIIPAYWVHIFRHFPPEFILVQFTIVGALIFAGSLCAVIRKITGSRTTTYLCLPLFLFGGSYEGILALDYLKTKGMSWTSFTSLNIDALTRWIWNTPQADTLYRALLFAPQHLLALSIFLIALIVWKYYDALDSRAVLYALIYSTLGFGVLIGATFIFGSLILLLHGTLRHPKERIRELIVAASIGVIFLLLYFVILKMFRVDNHDLSLGIVKNLNNYVFLYALMNWGAILIIGVLGLIWTSTSFPRRFYLVFLIFSAFFMHFVMERVGSSEVTLKLGYFSALCLLMLGASFINRIVLSTNKKLRWLAVGFVFVLLPGVLTWSMDAYNCQDVTNSKFTTYISKNDWNILAYVREHLNQNAIIQNDPLEGEGRRVSVIPPFAQRPMYLGDELHGRAFQVSAADYDLRRGTVWTLFNAKSAARISKIAQDAKIDYLLLTANDIGVTQVKNNLHQPYFTIVDQIDGSILARVNHVNVDISESSAQNNEVLIRDPKGNAILTADYDDKFYDPETLPGVGVIRWMSTDGKITLQAKKELHGSLMFHVDSLGRARDVDFYFNGKLLTSSKILRAGNDFKFPIKLTPGQNILSIDNMQAPDMAAQYARNGDTRLISIRIRDLKFSN